jgi:gliding motility-associated-like protein
MRYPGEYLRAPTHPVGRVGASFLTISLFILHRARGTKKNNPDVELSSFSLIFAGCNRLPIVFVVVSDNGPSKQALMHNNLKNKTQTNTIPMNLFGFHRLLAAGLLLRRAVSLLFLGMLFYTPLHGQNNYNLNWMFGEYAGITFNGPNAGPVTGSGMSAPRGVATISEQNGQLLYYTNGLRVWGVDHQLILNGDNLSGNPNSTQSALFVPYPEKPDDTYLFTTDALGGQTGLRYSLIRKDVNHTGMVLYGEKNILLHTPVTEKLVLLRHCNMKSYWAVAHEWGTNRFLAYHVNDEGLDTVPVITATGPVYSGALENNVGYMAASWEDNLLALAVTGSNRVDLFSFDNLLGTPEFLYSINNIYQPYGVVFSGDQNLLYVSGLDGRIYQYNLNAPNISASAYLVANTGKLTGALQMAPNNMIYIAREQDPYLGYIGSPNSTGISCYYVENGLFLAGNLSRGGLPPFIPRLEIPTLPDQTTCEGDTVFYNPLFLQRADSFILYFGDRLAGNHDSTTQVPAWYVAKEYGYTAVELIYYMCGEEYKLDANICMTGVPSVNLGPDTAICENIKHGLSAFLNDVYCPMMPMDFLWNNGATGGYLEVYPPGIYSVTVSNACGSGADTVHITGLPVPVVSLGPDQTLCQGDTALLMPLPTPDSLVWFDGTTDLVKMITKEGNYFVTVTNEFNCKASADVLIEFLDPPTRQWTMQDTTICIGHPLELNAGKGFDAYLWQDGSAGNSFLVLDSGWYHVMVSNICGTITDSLYVSLEDCRLKLFVPSAFVPNGDGHNDEFRAYAIYLDEFNMTIYNRWGQQVFFTEDPEKGWNGFYRDKPAPGGVYVYHIIYRDTTGKRHHLSGSVTLIR